MKPGHNDIPTVLLVHGMWSTEGTLSDMRDAFVEEGYQVEALCLPYHYPKAEHTPASKAKLARTRVQDYADYVVEQVKRQSSPPILALFYFTDGLVATGQLVAVNRRADQLIWL